MVIWVSIDREAIEMLTGNGVVIYFDVDFLIFNHLVTCVFKKTNTFVKIGLVYVLHDCGAFFGKGNGVFVRMIFLCPDHEVESQGFLLGICIKIHNTVVEVK